MVSTRSAGGQWRGIMLGVLSARTILFVVGFPVLAFAAHVALRPVANRFGMNDRARWLLVLSVWFVLGVVLAFLVWGLRALGLLQFAWGLLIPIGCTFIGYGLQRRVGSELHCTTCGYPFSDEGGVNCPECGSAWSATAGTTAGQPKRSPVLVVTGGVLIALAFTLSLSPIVAGRISRFVPTGVLIEQVTSVGGSSAGAWAELTKRSLTEQQTDGLIDRLLDQRARSGRLDSLSSAWLDGAFALGSLDDAQVARYFQEMTAFRLWEQPAADGADEGVVVISLMVDDRTTPFGAMEARVLFRGFTEEGEPVADSRMERYASVYRFDEWTQARKPGASVPSVTVVRQNRDAMAIGAEVWVIYGSAIQLSWGDAWAADGSPIIPSGLAWVEHIVLEHEVQPRE